MSDYSSTKTIVPHADPHASGYFLEAPVDSSNDGSTQTHEDMGTGSTIVPETPSNEGSTKTISSPNSPFSYGSSAEIMSGTSHLNNEGYI